MGMRPRDPCSGEVGADRMQERFGCFGEAEVAGVGQLDEPGVGEALGDCAAGGRRAHPVVGADEYERRDGDLGETRAQVVQRGEGREEVCSDGVVESAQREQPAGDVRVRRRGVIGDDEAGLRFGRLR